ncbi:MAG TPA: hypothetical protein VJI15_02070 [Candidatus Nanoarchaeia archaeon]|nr:hypothetical protein [Candidatus Nanoarchaeia archaeon]
MNYVIYKPSETVFLVGRERQQIQDTIERKIQEYDAAGREHGLVVPRDEQILVCVRLGITCGVADVGSETAYAAPVLDNVTLHMYPPAVKPIVEEARAYQSSSSGELVLFTPRRGKYMWYLPDDIMGAMRDYDWDRFLKRMAQQRGGTKKAVLPADVVDDTQVDQFGKQKR